MPSPFGGSFKKKREVREQIELVVLSEGVREESATGRRIVMIIETRRRSNRVAAFGRINRSEAVERSIVNRSKGDLTRGIPLRLLKRPCNTQLGPEGRIHGGLP